MKLRASLLLLAATATFMGCGPKPPPADAYQDAATLLSEMTAKRLAVKTLRASGRVDHFGKGQRIQGAVYVFARLPDALRVDLISPLGSSLAVLAAQDGRFAMHDTRQGRFLEGPALPCNIARLVQIPLPVEDVARILIGGTPVIEGELSLGWNDDKGAYALTIEDGDLTQSLLIGADRSVLPLQRSTLKRSNSVVFDIVNDRWTLSGSTWLPREIRVKMPAHRSDLLLRYDQDGVEANVDLPSDAFHLTAPSGMKVEDVTCE